MNTAFRRLATLLLLLFFCLGLGPGLPRSEAQAGPPPIAVQRTPLRPPAQACTGAFVSHELDHTTTVPGDTVDHFEANGAGVAVGDLDNDGDEDIVLGNHAGPNTILWNEGDLRFRSERMAHGDSRSVNLVDVDADGWLDIVFTRRTGGITFWRNTGGGHFQTQILPGIARPAYALAWGDLDGDGDLDLVTGSYDASLLDDLGNEFLTGGGAGVFTYQNQGGRFAGQLLKKPAQAMAIALFDIDGDGQRDIVVGNDFLVPDYAWLWAPTGWRETFFETMSHSTMSLDAGDIDNDGRFELFSTDMMPPIGQAEDPAAVAAWEPIMADMVDPLPGDPQIMANVLQAWSGVAGYQDAARPRGLAATGWTWSAKFGDLDQDGLLDLYAVNGMAESTMMAHLPNHELVEENQALRNIGDGYFRPAPSWQLGSTSGGRGMSMADLDGDGDLDIVVNNLRSPAQLFENRLCGGASLLVDLSWPGSANTHALGATVILKTSAGDFTRDVRSGSGYLSGDSPRLHFGLPAIARPQALEIHWPDGAVSTVTDLQPNTLVRVSRQQPQTTVPLPTEVGSLDADLRAIIAARGLTGDPSTGRDLPGIDSPLAQLGMKLFFSKALGGDFDSACVSCHHPLLGGGDGLPLSIGVGAPAPDLLGPGRAHPSGLFNVPRNAPSTFNIGLWERVLFHDGRIEKLGDAGIRTPDVVFGQADPAAGADMVAAQARFPVTSVEEMRGHSFERHRPNEFVRAHLIARLGNFGVGRGELADPGWTAEFQNAYGASPAVDIFVAYEGIAAAISAYERSQVFVNTPWKQYVQGDEAALAEGARRGALLFFRLPEEGGAGCAACHSGDFFTDEQFYTLAVPQIGMGKGDGRFGDDDFGRFRESGRPEDLYAFRTPTLLNVEVTGPYGHDGAYPTLEAIVRHHLNPAAAVAAYDPTLIDPQAKTEHMAENTSRALAKLAADRAAGRTPLRDLALSDRQIADLVEFLRALTDPCVKDPACLAPWIPGEREDVDGLQVRATIEAPEP
ncbi:MAG: FG-GAP-like repeat-containing protein [Caldilineales bacterium]|nr:FG-GAP-like repeat-containing protein [Caldilineales bacterium]MCW5858879.1 VCBS repeat-containing protein [Caldilineales bacterium]